MNVFHINFRVLEGNKPSTKNFTEMKTHKANAGEWREKVMKSLKLDYTIDANNQIVYKGDLKGYNTLVDLLVSERIKLGILPY